MMWLAWFVLLYLTRLILLRPSCSCEPKKRIPIVPVCYDRMLRWSRTRFISPALVEGGGIKRAASAPMRFSRSASSFFLYSIRVCRSMRYLLSTTKKKMICDRHCETRTMGGRVPSGAFVLESDFAPLPGHRTHQNLGRLSANRRWPLVRDI